MCSAWTKPGLGGTSRTPGVPTTYWTLRAGCLQGWQEEAGRANRAARPGSEAGAANLLSLLFRASVQVICWVKLGVHSQIIYPGKEEEVGEPRRTWEIKKPEVLGGAWGPVTSLLHGRAGRSGARTGLRNPEQRFLALGWCMQCFQPW